MPVHIHTFNFTRRSPPYMDIKHLVDSILVPHTAFTHALNKLDQCYAYAPGASEPICLALIGESRTGKSRVIEEFCHRHPPARLKESLSMPILRVRTPSHPTVKGLVELLLGTIGDPRFASGTENAKTIRLKHLMREVSTNMVVLDEFQHFFDKGSQTVMHHVADWLKILADESRCALVVAGLPTCKAVIDQNEQLAGRFAAPIVMPRFNWTVDEDRQEFIAILQAFDEVIATVLDCPLLATDDMAFRCFCSTGGLVGILSKFLRQLVWNASVAGKKVLALTDLQEAHKQSVWSIQRETPITGQSGPVMPNPYARDFLKRHTQEELLLWAQSVGRPAPRQTGSSRRGRKKSVSADYNDVFGG